MKKNHASSENRNKNQEFLPAVTLWRAAQYIETQGIPIQPNSSEPTPLEITGATIGILRRRKNLSRLQLAQKANCPVEELLAMEMGLSQVNVLAKHLPKILQELGVTERFFRHFIHSLKLA